jgi:hypothetical protein
LWWVLQPLELSVCTTQLLFSILPGQHSSQPMLSFDNIPSSHTKVVPLAWVCTVREAQLHTITAALLRSQMQGSVSAVQHAQIHITSTVPVLVERGVGSAGWGLSATSLLGS